jgi:hypothetical protein
VVRQVARYDKLRMTATGEDEFLNVKMLQLSGSTHIACIA